MLIDKSIEHSTSEGGNTAQETAEGSRHSNNLDDRIIEGNAVYNSSNNSGADMAEKDVEKGEVPSDERVGEGSPSKHGKQKDQNLVEWDGPNDPGNPLNWSVKKKWIVTIMLGFVTLVVTFASSVFSSATLSVAELYHVSTEVATLGTSLFVLGFGAGPLVRMPSNLPLRSTTLLTYL